MASEKVMMGLDIGSGWIRAIVGSLSSDGQLMVDSLCERKSEGIKNGVVVNVEQACATIGSVMQESELQAGAEIGSVIVGIGGQSIRGYQSEGVTGINSKGLEITSADIYRALEVARTFNLPSDLVILHTLVQDFTVDSTSGIKNPIAMVGSRLESRALVVTASALNCSNTKKCIKKAGINDCRIVATMLADAESVLSQDEKDMGAILVNIGANCTDMIAYVNGSPVYVGAIDFGADNVTMDLVNITSRPKQVIEQLKCEVGSCFVDSVKKDEMVTIPKVAGMVGIKLPRTEFCKIIEARMAEIFAMLVNKLKESHIRGAFGAGVVLVGGGALLSGTADLASEIFGMQSRIGFPEALPGLDRSYISPQYSTVLGLLKTEAKKTGSDSDKKGNTKTGVSYKQGFIKKIGNFFKTVV